MLEKEFLVTTNKTRVFHSTEINVITFLTLNIPVYCKNGGPGFRVSLSQSRRKRLHCHHIERVNLTRLRSGVNGVSVSTSYEVGVWYGLGPGLGLAKKNLLTNILERCYISV